MKISKITNLILSASMVTGPLASAEMTLPTGQRTNLTTNQRDALLRAEKVDGDLEWRVMTAEIAGRPRTVVLLGEIHYALDKDLAITKDVFGEFAHFAVENGGRHDERRYEYAVAPVAFALMLPVAILSSIFQGRVLGSPMDYPSSAGHVKSLRNAEILHRPTAGEEFDLAFLSAAEAGSVVALGFILRSLYRMARTQRIYGHRLGLVKAVGAYLGIQIAQMIWARDVTERPLLKNRDVDMARFIDQWVHDGQNDEALVVIVGKLHLANLTKFLTEKYGFQPTELECGPAGCGVLAHH